MTTDEERCARAARLQRIDEAFTAGNLEALRAAVDDPSLVPNGDLSLEFGSCLVYAIYRSPLSFIRTLLEAGADPNVQVDDGFPPLIAALSCLQRAPGVTPRADVDEIVRLLLTYGADPDQRGINDYTPLHMAVSVRAHAAIQTLLEAGANPELRTRIDECETPEEMARAAGLADLAALLTRKGALLRKRLRSGLVLLTDVPGSGNAVRRQRVYDIRLRLWLNKGEAVRWHAAWGPVGIARLEEECATLFTRVRVDRRSLISGLFYGIDGMHVGGTRRLEIAPHLAYGDRGVPGVIPATAVLVAEIHVIGESGRTVEP